MVAIVKIIFNPILFIYIININHINTIIIDVKDYI